ncbi:MAG: hypothetical protein HDT26_04665 [Subdoligranulum sp.]|nr:hypothetical protein [Subdoligranulum sp.]
MPQQRTVLCIQDLSCVGRSSLAVVLPTLAAAGASPCALPTALLSTHYGGFGAPAESDESAFALAALEHYGRLGLAFDCVYSGYLPDARQAALVERAYAQSPAALRVADPAMADHGRLYSALTPEVCAAQARLCAQADVIVPNATEAALLLEEDGETGASGLQAMRHAALLLERFPHLRCAVVTGAAAGPADGSAAQPADGENAAKPVDGGAAAPADESMAAPANGSRASPTAKSTAAPAAKGAAQRGNVCAVRGAQPVFLPYEAVPQAYPGTGDLFAAALTGAMLAGRDAQSAVSIAARFVSGAARDTLRAGADARFGVRFEPLLGALAEWVRRPLQG